MVYLFISIGITIASIIGILLNNVYAKNWRIANADFVKELKDVNGQNAKVSPNGNAMRNNILVIVVWIALVNSMVATCIFFFS